MLRARVQRVLLIDKTFLPDSCALVWKMVIAYGRREKEYRKQEKGDGKQENRYGKLEKGAKRAIAALSVICLGISYTVER